MAPSGVDPSRGNTDDDDSQVEPPEGDCMSDPASQRPSARDAALARHWRLVLALAGSLALAAGLVPALSGAADPAPSTAGPGSVVSATGVRGAVASRPGLRAMVVFRPAASLSYDQAFAAADRVIRARAAALRPRLGVDVARAGRDRMHVTVLGTRQPIAVQGLISGSSVAAYDLNAELIGTFSGLRPALRRARELEPSAPASEAYFFHRAAVRGPAPNAAALRPLLRSQPRGEVLELPRGLAILTREYARNARGDAERLRPTQYLLVRDRPALGPLQVIGAGRARTDTSRPGRPVDLPIRLTGEGRARWAALLDAVAARAGALGAPQRVVVSSSGEVWQLITADASGRLDARTPVPTLQFGSFFSGRSGFGLRIPVESNVPEGGSLPARVWLSDVRRLGPAPRVRGERGQTVPVGVRRLLGGLQGPEGPLPGSIVLALRSRGPEGEYAIWEYATRAGAVADVVSGPREREATGFSCRPSGRVGDCGGTGGYQVYAVPAATRVLRVRVGSAPAQDFPAANGWALVLGADRSRGEPRRGTVTALDDAGRVLGRLSGRLSLPAL